MPGPAHNRVAFNHVDLFHKFGDPFPSISFRFHSVSDFVLWKQKKREKNSLTKLFLSVVGFLMKFPIIFFVAICRLLIIIHNIILWFLFPHYEEEKRISIASTRNPFSGPLLRRKFSRRQSRESMMNTAIPIFIVRCVRKFERKLKKKYEEQHRLAACNFIVGSLNMFIAATSSSLEYSSRESFDASIWMVGMKQFWNACRLSDAW